MYALCTSVCVCARVFTPVEPIVSGSVIIVQPFPPAAATERQTQGGKNTLNHQPLNNEESIKLTSSSLLRPPTSKPHVCYALFHVRHLSPVFTSTHRLTHTLAYLASWWPRHNHSVQTNNRRHGHTHSGFSHFCPEVTGLECDQK